MARRSRRSRNQILFSLLSLAVVLSMALGYALIAAPAPEPQPSPAPSATPPDAAGQPSPASPTQTASPSTPVPLPPAATLDPATTTYSFAVLGDSRSNPHVYTALLDRIVEDGNVFIVHLGDLVENGTAAEFQDWREMMAAYDIPCYTVPGNHDANQGSLAEYLAFTGAPGAHYSFDRGLVHFALVDSHRGYLTTEETAWLEADLAATEQPVKIVALHYPPFDPRGSSKVMTRGNETFLSLMKKYDIQYVFAGHVHAYDQTNRDGVLYIISGGGGAPLDRSEEEGGFYHYVQVTVDGTDVRTAVQRLTP